MDPIDQAIAASEPAPALPPMSEIPVMINSTGRPAILGVPTDITDQEVMELTAWMLNSLRGHIAANLRGSSPIIVARGRVDR